MRAIRLYQYLQKQRDSAGWILGKQYLRAATSIGANIEEAQASESRADFVRKVGIAQKEARESLFWLRLLTDSHIVSNSCLKPLTQGNRGIDCGRYSHRCQHEKETGR
ncbi:MAG: four helix bundle protein [Terriglobia bacterium]